MILKGSKRGGAADLGKHLLKAENEHIDVHEIRGFVADTVVDALKEAHAISRGTKCRKFLFSLALSPPERESVPVEAFADAIGSIEEKLGLGGQPRIVIFHEKEGRRHAHCVWSRINPETMTAIDLPHFKLKLGDISRKLYLEHGWKMPDGLIDPAFRNPLNFDRHEWFQAKRTGQDPRAIKAVFLQCWAASDSGTAFRSALESRGYWIARGDRRGVVAVDIHGEVYAVARWVDVKTKEVNARIGDLDKLPAVSDVQAQVADLVGKKVSGFIDGITAEFAQAARSLEGQRLALVERHRAERRDLQAAQDERWAEEARSRAARFRKGLRGLWDRVTGQHTKVCGRNEQETAACAERDANEKQQLIDRQLRARQHLQRNIRHSRHAHLRELTRFYRESTTLLVTEENEGSADLRRDRGNHQRRSYGPEL